MDKEKWKNFKDLKPIEQRSKPTFNYPDGEVLNGIIIDEIVCVVRLIKALKIKNGLLMHVVV